MNLPASATDFLDVFRGAFCRELWPEECLPTVHVYAFSASADPKEDIRQRVTGMLTGGLGGLLNMELHLVRDVAPKKLMVCSLGAETTAVIDTIG
jgi:tRNA (guanine37-N1)-methyltransferase